jgi:hypothetical protein
MLLAQLEKRPGGISPVFLSVITDVLADITREVAGWPERPGVSVPTESRIATLRELRAVAADARAEGRLDEAEMFEAKAAELQEQVSRRERGPAPV